MAFVKIASQGEVDGVIKYLAVTVNGTNMYEEPTKYYLDDADGVSAQTIVYTFSMFVHNTPCTYTDDPTPCRTFSVTRSSSGDAGLYGDETGRWLQFL